MVAWQWRWRLGWKMCVDIWWKKTNDEGRDANPDDYGIFF
jgi:hypothetical protein